MNLARYILAKRGFIHRDEMDEKISRLNAQVGQYRMFAASMSNRLSADWLNVASTIDQDIRSGIRMVRNRARDLTKNNDYAKKFTRLLRLNVVGPYGFKLQVKAKNPDGTLDKLANTKIEEAWLDWSRRKNCSVDGKLSFRAASDLLINHTGRDGEGMVRFVRDRSAKYGMRLQVIDPEMLDENRNIIVSKTSLIKMGVEIDMWRRPLAYYLFKSRPDQDIYSTGYTTIMQHEIISANDILHGFDQEYANQTRGISWLVQSMVRLKWLSGYEEAALVNARTAAAKMGFFFTPPEVGKQYEGQDKDANKNTITAAEPGSFEQLPPGMQFAPWTPEYPAAQHEMFVRTQMRGISSGLGLATSSLSNDLSDVNYSSIRAGLVEEREQWKLVQQWFTETYLEQIFETWLESAILSGDLNLPMSKFDKFNQPVFVGKRWAWVDPLKDLQAKILEVQAGFTTATQVVAEYGDDIEEIYQELADEKKLANSLGLTLKLDEIKVDPNASSDQQSVVDAKARDILDEAIRILQTKTNGHGVPA